VKDCDVWLDTIGHHGVNDVIIKLDTLRVDRTAGCALWQDAIPGHRESAEASVGGDRNGS
jgi:hypothetical protein